jgi:4-amino-4-deoxy-L-arabinose transferase-like glycosyltransferase
MDEYCYLYQAKIFSRGKLFIHVDETSKPFIEHYMILKNNKLFSQYPPGFPLILAIGVIFNVAGLTNPLISVLTLLILYLFVKSFLGGKYALLSIILMSTTPYFLAYSASYYSQSTALFMTVLIVFSLRKYELTSKRVYLILLGLFSGYSLLTRPLDSFCVVIPSYIFLIFIIHKKNDWRNFFYSVSLFIMLFAVFLTYNYILGDKISLGLFPVVTSSFRIVDPAAQGLVQNVVNIANDYYHNGVKFIPMFLGKYLLIPSGLFILLLGIVGIWKFKSKWKWLLIANFLMLIFFYNFHRGFSWPSYGARYYYSGFGSLVVLGTFGFKKVVEVLESRSVVLFLLSLILCTNMVFGTILFHKYSDRFKIKLGILENIASQCFSSDIVILDPKGKKPGRRTCRRKVEDWEIDLGSEKRNMFMNGPRLLMDIGDKDLEEILGDFPNNSICVYKYDNLNELRCYDN